jgi:CRP/FNR family transcriptional regulator, anaerobic regulatory protein
MEVYNGPVAKAQIREWVGDKFSQLAEPGLLEDIVEHGQLMRFDAGEVIQDTGSYIRYVPLVIDGSIKVSREEEDGREIFLYYLGAGHTCSMSFSCCLMQKRSNIRTVCEEDTTIVALPIKQVDDWMNSYTSWRNFVMKSYDDRMSELIYTIDSIAFQNLDERLEDYLHKKYAATGEMKLKTTHQEIAFDLNASREAVSRLLKKMEREGRVKLGRSYIEMVH